VQAVSDRHWRVVMENRDLADLCGRQDRKALIEQAVQQAFGRRIRIDFASPSSSEAAVLGQPPRNKTQVLRDLQTQPFVARLTEVFQAQWTDLLPTRPRPESAAGERQQA